LAEGLVRLGIPRAESRHRVREAFTALIAAGASGDSGEAPELPSEEAVLRRALVM